jgi:hypothetical protein
MYRIQSVAADPKALTLTLSWEGGAVTTKDMSPLVSGRRVFRPLADPALFAKAHIINDGRAVAWNDDIDMCADALWYEAHPEANPHRVGRAAE